MPNTSCGSAQITTSAADGLGLLAASVSPQHTASDVTPVPILKNGLPQQQQQDQKKKQHRSFSPPRSTRPTNAFRQEGSTMVDTSFPTYPSTVDWDLPIQETDFLYRRQIAGLRPRRAGVTKVSIFDFDNTLFKSPLPNPRIWDKTLIGMLKSTDLGWFHDSRTLDKPYLKYTRNHWIGETVKQVRNEVMNSDTTLVVLLTGRSHSSYRPLILDLVSRNPDLHFDLVVLKETPTRQSPLMSPVGSPAPNSSAARAATPLTFDYKMRVVEDIVTAFPAISQIKMWDDRINHCHRMQQYLDALKFRTGTRFSDAAVLYVPPQTIYMDPAKERRLVRSMIDAHNDHVHERALTCGIGPDHKDYSVGALQTQSRLAYVGVTLLPQSTASLQAEVRSPRGWTLDATHMVLVDEGDASETVLQTQLGAKDGDIVTVVVDCIGTIPGATIAVRVAEVRDALGNALKPKPNTDDNDIDEGNNSTPYITVAYNGVEGYRLSRGDNIRRWRPLASGRLVLEGVIGKHSLTAASLVMPKPVINEVSVGRLVCNYWPELRGKEIGTKISEINRRLDERGIENLQINKDAIEEIVKSHAFKTQEQELPP
ncbi:hypothetical protein GGI11_001745 [Coemansia sp. RSA 2049]|nr:hypothetical protein GGI11_001745 [Coemansia sp. RSA 2049]